MDNAQSARDKDHEPVPEPGALLWSDVRYPALNHLGDPMLIAEQVHDNCTGLSGHNIAGNIPRMAL